MKPKHPRQYPWPINPVADKAMRFFRNLHLVDDFAGTLFEPRPFQEYILRGLYGRLDRRGRRITKRATLLFPRKAGKTLVAAMIGLKGLLTEGQNQMILSAAASKDQARRIFDTMRQIIEQDELLDSLCHIKKSTATIECFQTNSIYAAASSGERSAYGWSPTIVIADELHAWTKPSHRELYLALTTGRAARKDPFTITISTQASNPFSLAGEEFDYCKKLKHRMVNGEVIKTGEIDNPAYLACLYYADPEKDDWTSEDLWRRVNPGLGDYLDIEDYRDNFKIAQDIPSRAAGFKQQYLNIAGAIAGKKVDPEQWRATKGPVDAEALKGKECWAALDLAPVSDLSSLVLLFPDDGKMKVLCYSWCSQDDIHARSRLEKVPYDLWQKAGWIKATPGNATDFGTIRDDILALSKKYRIKRLGVDMTYAHQLSQELSDAGVKVEQFVQGFKSFGPAVAAFDRLLLERKLVHDENKVLDYCIFNLACETDAVGNEKPSNKLKYRHEKIDAAVALIMSCGLWNADLVVKETGYAKRARERKEREAAESATPAI